MKRSLCCPKCDGKKLWRIERFRHQTDVVGGSELCVAITDRDRIWTGSTVIGAFDMFVCAGCGYSELWARDFESLRPKPEEGVFLIEPGTKPPYRS